MTDALIEPGTRPEPDEDLDAPEPGATPVADPSVDGDRHAGLTGRVASAVHRTAAHGRRLYDEQRPKIVKRARSLTLTEKVTAAVVAACVVFVFWELQPLNLLSATTPSGGDMAAHVWGPAYLRDHLLPKGRLSGWSPDWYAGYPAFQFYMVVPFLVIALLSYVIPYGIAFKLVAVSGCVSLPVACYLFGRLNRLPFPVPPLLAVGATLFLFDRSFSIYGGNIASTLAGEFCFSISLSLAVLYLGVLGAGLRTGRHRGWAALLLGLTGLCHLIPFIFALVGTLVWLAMRPSRRSLRYVLTAGPVGVLLLAFWMGPFYGRGGYVNDMGWTKLTAYWAYLVTRDLPDSTLRNSPDLRLLLILAIAGVVMAAVARLRAALYLAVLGAVTGLGFVLLGRASFPIVGDRLWNARLLPFYYLCVYLMAGVGVALALRVLAGPVAGWLAGDRVGEDDRRFERTLLSGAVGLVCVATMLVIAAPMRSMPGGREGADGVYRWGLGPFQKEQTDRSFLPDWIDWNFGGLQSWRQAPQGTDAAGNEILGPPTYDRSYPEFYDLVNTMKQVGADHGCGRAMWEYEDQHNRYGSPMEPMMLPFFTNSCIGSMEGLYFEASATTPYHFINSTELSKLGSAAQRDLPYPTMPKPSQYDFDLGVSHLQLLGVRYYLAIDDFTKGRAAANPALSKITDTGPWTVYLVANSELVAPLANQPAVLTGQAMTGLDWQNTSMCWYMNPQDWGVTLVDRGPEDWQRIDRSVVPDAAASPQDRCHLGTGAAAGPAAAPWSWLNPSGGPAAQAEPVSTQVTNISSTDDSISFDVSQIGVPVLVKTSYFPNWKVDGADGIARAAPNLMVVTPSATHVELHYGWTGLDLVCYLATLLGLVALVFLFRSRPLVATTATSANPQRKTMRSRPLLLLAGLGATVGLLAVSCGSSGRDLPAPLAGVAAPTRSSEAGAAGASGASASASAGGGLQLVASAFAPGGPVPPEYGCDGPAPELTWSGKLPDGTNELALVARDPQTGSVHWFVAGISAGAHTSPKGGTPENVAQLVNSAGKNGYAGPCPPPGEVKRIEFSVVALSGSAALPVTTAAADAWARIQPKILGRAVLEGAFTGVTPPAAPQ